MTRVLITGASSGIGAELAREFHRAGHRLVLTARRGDRLEALATELGGAEVVVADLADPQAPAQLFAATGPVDILVNNAGFGAGGRFAELGLDRQMAMLQVNVAALTELTHRYLAPMRAANRGRILNVASTVSFQPAPGMALYGATKAFVLSLSEALWSELEGSGITVTCLCPGSTATAFFDVAGMGASPFRRAMPAARVAAIGYRATMAGRRLVVAGGLNALMAGSVRFAPRGLVLRLARRILA